MKLLDFIASNYEEDICVNQAITFKITYFNSYNLIYFMGLIDAILESPHNYFPDFQSKITMILNATHCYFADFQRVTYHARIVG